MGVQRFRSGGVNRRVVLAGAAATAAIGPFRATGVEARQATPTASGEWTFADDKGVTVTLPARPERIVADVNAAAPLWDFGIRPLAVFGWNATETGDFGPAGGNVDPSQVEVVGDATETINLEKTVGVNPDLIVTITWEPDNPEEYWSIEPDVVSRVREIAPIVAISAAGMADANTERFAELAVLLGVDLQSPELTEAKAGYDASLANFPDAAAAKSDLSVLFFYVEPGDVIYVADPAGWADLTLYESLGLNVIHPDASDGWWETLSLEQAMKYQVDVMLYSTRPGTLTADELKAHPVLGLLPAVKAGQIGAWNQDFIMSYQGMKIALDDTIAVVEAASKIV